jgi:hypothetical protein
MTAANLWADFGPAVYRVWANYWLAANCAPPPIRLHKPTLSGGALFLAPVGSPWVRGFVKAHTNDAEFIFENQGEELPNWDPSNYGLWGSFSAIRRTNIPQPLGRPVLPVALPKPPDPHELRDVRDAQRRRSRNR